MFWAERVLDSKTLHRFLPKLSGALEKAPPKKTLHRFPLFLMRNFPAPFSMGFVFRPKPRNRRTVLRFRRPLRLRSASFLFLSGPGKGVSSTSFRGVVSLTTEAALIPGNQSAPQVYFQFSGVTCSAGSGTQAAFSSANFASDLLAPVFWKTGFSEVRPFFAGYCGRSFVNQGVGAGSALAGGSPRRENRGRNRNRTPHRVERTGLCFARVRNFFPEKKKIEPRRYWVERRWWSGTPLEARSRFQRLHVGQKPGGGTYFGQAPGGTVGGLLGGAKFPEKAFSDPKNTT